LFVDARTCVLLCEISTILLGSNSGSLEPMEAVAVTPSRAQTAGSSAQFKLTTAQLAEIVGLVGILLPGKCGG
jgi:hypothetical protein